MSQPPHLQLGLFSGCAAFAGMHLVAAHSRQLADGTSVFVAEHLRWNGGRQPREPAPARPAEPLADQPGLFDRR